MADITVTIHGPVFDGRAPAVMRALLAEATWQVGAQGLADVHLILDQKIKHPTPYYETQVTVQRAAADVVVHDRGVIYGPWLEGVSSRNQSTRFKGYHAFRTAAQELEGKIPDLVEPVVRRHLAGLD